MDNEVEKVCVRGNRTTTASTLSMISWLLLRSKEVERALNVSFIAAMSRSRSDKLSMTVENNQWVSLHY